MNASRHLLAALSLTALFISQTGCKKSDPVDPTKGFSAKIQSIIPQAEIDKLRQRGMTINEGSQPPSIEGIFVSSPHTLVSPYDGDTYKAGETFSDLVLRFSGQSSTDQTATVELKSGNSVGSGIGGFIAGNGNKFTFFAEINVTSGTATAKQVRIFSGEMTSTGIKDLYTTLLITSKNDPNDQLIPVGAARIIKDGDGLASKRSTFRQHAEALPAPTLPTDDTTR